MWIVSLLIAIIILAIGQAAFFRYCNFRGLTYKRWFEPSVVIEGDDAIMVETVRNEKLMPIPWVRIEAEISPNIVFASDANNPNRNEDDKGKHYHRSMFALPPYTTITRRHRVKCIHRGYYNVKSVSAATGDLLGLGKNILKDIETNSLMVVYPALLPMEDIFADKNSFTGDTVVRRWIVEDPFMIKGVREYTSSDPYNHINWKATARTGRLQVHDFDFTADIKLMIIVNVDANAEQWTVATDDSIPERALSMAATIAQYAIDNGVETGFTTNGKPANDPDGLINVAPESGLEQTTAIFEAISRTTLTRSATFGTFLQRISADRFNNCDVLLITAYTDENIDEQIDKMRQSGINVELKTPVRDEMEVTA